MENKLEHIVYSRNVIEFVTVSSEYCVFIEEINSCTKKQFVQKAQKLLPLLYLKGTLIPRLENECEDVIEKYVTEDIWQNTETRIKSKLGKHNDYIEVFDPDIDYSETPVPASISENMADIYQDMKDFIVLYRIGTTEIMNDALLECRQNFEQYWGQKLLNALRAIHNIVYNIDWTEEETETESTDYTKSSLENIDTSNWIINRMQQQYRENEEEDK